MSTYIERRLMDRQTDNRRG